MFTARKASVEDCGLIREMACVAFPDTYKTILSPEQFDTVTFDMEPTCRIYDIHHGF